MAKVQKIDKIVNKETLEADIKYLCFMVHPAWKDEEFSYKVTVTYKPMAYWHLEAMKPSKWFIKAYNIYLSIATIPIFETIPVEVPFSYYSVHVFCK